MEALEYVDQIEFQVGDLKGAGLDYFTGIACGFISPLPHPLHTIEYWLTDQPRVWVPSTHLDQCSRFIDQYKMNISHYKGRNGQWICQAEILNDAFLVDDSCICQTGETLAIAVCRAVCAARFGKTVTIPKRLAYCVA